ncbi:PKD domain-containing protein [Ornithinimicrobium murale]|uniref:PKD domain-containing protein n=1 Tax=Ornithinimicrobium murale TaxID=1050153 RepID=UPI0013B4056F|nr:PKD domain-containing protein [Ornithinimicrobium murale]
MSAMFRMPRVLLVAVTALATAVGLGLPASAAPPPTVTTTGITPRAETVGAQHAGVVSAVPVAWTPQVLDGKVLAIAQAGDTMVAGGSFTSVSQTWGGTTQDRQRIFAFDATEGSIRSGFNPSIPSGRVNAIIPGPTSGTVYVGGTFPGINGESGKVFLLNVSNGSIVSSFAAPAMNGQVRDLALSGDTLYVGGLFREVGGEEHGGLVALNAASGARLDFLSVQLTENHNWTEGSDGARAGVGAMSVAVDPAGTTLAVIGNFRKADGLDRRQMTLIDLTGPTAEVRPDWRTRRYEPGCYSWAFDTYMRDLAASPDGEYFAVGTTGGGNPGTLCDTVARWDVDDSGDDVQPTWVDESGGDSILGVTTSGTAVYAGGHQRWGNNMNGRDFPAIGSVPRPGLTGLDGASGVPLSWNPARHPRGVGAEAFTSTEAGLWMGSDTLWVGKFDYRRARLAFFPTDGGYDLGSGNTGELPSNVYYIGLPPLVQEDVLFRVNAAGPELPALDQGPAWAGDEAADSPWRNSGSNAATWTPVPSVTSDVPPTTPAALFDSERWDPGIRLDGGEMSWSFPVPSGEEITVRLYLANRYSGTSQPGQRVFDVVLDGTTVLDDYDIAADVGHDTGTVQEFDITSDGAVDIQFLHEVENPLIDGIEIVMQSDEPAPEPEDPGLQHVWFTGGAVDISPGQAPPNDIDWSTVRGAEMIDGELFYVTDDRQFWRRTFDGETFGPATAIDPYNDPYWADYPTGSGSSTYGGVQPSFYGQIPTVRGLAYQDHQLYYTRAGSSSLFARGFLADSGILRETTRTVPGFDQANVGELFFDPAGGYLYFSNSVTGNLSRISWADGEPQGAASAVSGPAIDGMDWRTAALFLAAGPPPSGSNEEPTASIISDCTGLVCSFDGSASSDTDGTVESYSWDFGDGATTTGPVVSHEYTEVGEFTVTLAVTDDDGATGATSQVVSVQTENVAPLAVVNTSCDELTCFFDGSGSSDSDGTITSYEWDFGDGASGSGVTSEHEYAQSGTFSVALTVTDNDSATHTATQELVVEAGNVAPDAAMDVSCAQLVCEFDGSLSSDSDGTVESYSWDFGDGSTATGPLVSHEFAEAGSQTVSLTVIDNDGATDTVSETLQVVVGNEAPVAAMDVSCAQLLCEFDGSLSSDGDGSVESYSWDFGDGGTAVGAVVSHEFAASGEFTVALTVVDDAGASDTASTQVMVNDEVSPGEPEVVAVAATQGHATGVSLQLPDGIEAGDAILAFLTASDDEAVATSGVVPWVMEEETVLSPMSTRLFSRVADGSESGQAVTFTGSSVTKWDLTVVVYRGAAGEAVEVVAVDVVRNTATHVSPVVQVTGEDRVGLTYWSDRGGSTTEWIPPTGPTVLSTQVGTGGGRVSSLLVAESAPIGPYGGLVAETNAPTSRAMSMTAIIRA